MQAIRPSSHTFAKDQQTQTVVEYWDSPMTPLIADNASSGIKFDLKEPLTDGTFTLLDVVQNTAAASVGTDWANATKAKTVVSNGRIPNLIGYWAGGAPGYHGASVARKVGYHFTCVLRTVAQRNWFSSSEPISNMALILVGNGHFRIVKNDTTDIFNNLISEEDFTDSSKGATWTATFSLAAGDVLDVYYVQNDLGWGGFVVKVFEGTVPAVTDLVARADAAREAPVVGCGLMDDGVLPVKQTLTDINELEVRAGVGETRQASFQVALLNPNTANDDVGWEYVRTGGDTTGFLRLHVNSGTDIDVRRQRLVRIQMGFREYDGTNELFNVFTGMIDDIEEPQNGLVNVVCLGLEQRLVDQFVKNYPDKLSYMSYHYNNLTGTTTPVYDIQAYDNWPIEFALRDLLVRAGIDESRTRATLTVPQADGTTVDVLM